MKVTKIMDRDIFDAIYWVVTEGHALKDRLPMYNYPTSEWKFADIHITSPTTPVVTPLNI